MNKFSNLKKLFNEIELLESAGLYKAANVLHKNLLKKHNNTIQAIQAQKKIELLF